MSKQTWEGRQYKIPEVIPAPLPLGTRVKIDTQGLVVDADRRYGRVIRYEGEHVKVLVDPPIERSWRVKRPNLGTVWLYPWDVTEVKKA